MALGEIKSVQLANGLAVVAPVGIPLSAARLELQEVTPPATPPTGFFYLYVKSDGFLYSKDDAGVERAYEASDADLTAIAALSGTGLIARTGAGTAAVRTITAGTTRIGVTNGDGVSGNPTIDVNEGSLSLPNIGGTLTIAKGGTGAATAQAAFNALSPQTTKGDLVVNDGTNDVRLPVGVDGEALVARSTETTGLRWEVIGAGATEVNAVSNPSAVSNTAGWTTTTGHTLSRITSGAPLSPVVATAFRVNSISGGAEGIDSGVYTSTPTLTLPPALRSRLIKFQAYVNVPNTVGDVWRISIREMPGGTRLVLSTDIANVTTLQAGFIGVFTTYFRSTSSADYRVNITKTAGSTSSDLDFTRVEVSASAAPLVGGVIEYVAYSDTAATAAGATYSTAGNIVRTAAGAQLQNVSNSSTDNDTSFEMTWVVAQQPTDLVYAQLSLDSGSTWVPMEVWYPRAHQNLARFGSRVDVISSTSIRLRLGNRGATPETAATYGSSSGIAWNPTASSAIRWRIVKVSQN